MTSSGRSIANQWAQDWARGRRGGKGQTRTGQNTDRIGQKRPEWLGPRLGVSEAIEAAGRKGWSLEAETRLMSALAVIPADNRDTWVPYGAAMHDTGWPSAFEIFHRWSQTNGGDKYKGRDDCAYTWKSFDRPYSGIPATLASIYADARARGWVDPGSVSSKFNGVDSAPHVISASILENQISFKDLDGSGNPKETCANVRVALTMLGIECRYDLFHERQYVAGQVIEQWAGEIADNSVLALRAVIQAQFDFDPPTQTTIDALTMECLDHAYDPLLDYLDGLQWDGQPRLRTWTRDYLGVEDTPLNRMIAGLSLTAAVRRARKPGTKFDHVVVLEGLEGLGKSSAVAILAGVENFSDQEILTLDERRQQEALQGVWLYEIAELAGMHRADIERVKAFVTRTMDRTRPAYGRKRVDRPRRCVFFASCNNERYLQAQTGNRRFWPLKCSSIDRDGLTNVRDQLWAEASLIESKGISLALDEKFWPLAAEIQESRRVQDPWEIALETIERCNHAQLFYDAEREFRIATSDLIGPILEIPLAQQTTPHYQRLGNIMRKFGWEGPKVIRIRVFENKPETRTVRGFTKYF